MFTHDAIGTAKLQLAAAEIADRRGRSPVVVLPPAAGYDVDIEVDTASVERSEVDCGELNTQDGGHGTRLIGRPAVTALCELFAEPATRPRVLALWAPTGSGATTAIRTLARAARMHGHVPVSTGLGAQLRAVVAQRTLLLIAPTPADGWRHALWSVLQSARP